LSIYVKHFQVERFSYDHEDFYSGVFVWATVGEACYRIIVDHVEVYRRYVTRIEDERPRSLWFIDDECGGIDKWWKSRQGKNLAELQLEAIEWVLRQKKETPRPSPPCFEIRACAVMG